MSPPEYVRPTTIPEALAALKGGTALAGGTTIARRARSLVRLVDLQALGIDRLQWEGDRVRIGAMVRLQQIVETGDLPAGLRDACRREAGLNLRSMSSLGGTLLTCSGRSPLATVMLALRAQVRMEPGPQQWSYDELLARRESLPQGLLITSIVFPLPAALAHAGVARSPADRPTVYAALARMAGRTAAFGLALGGFGAHPILLPEAELALAAGDVASAAAAARAACAGAEDEWASAEYRAEVAATLVQRLAREVGV